MHCYQTLMDYESKIKELENKLELIQTYLELILETSARIVAKLPVETEASSFEATIAYLQQRLLEKKEQFHVPVSPNRE